MKDEILDQIAPAELIFSNDEFGRIDGIENLDAVMDNIIEGVVCDTLEELNIPDEDWDKEFDKAFRTLHAEYYQHIDEIIDELIQEQVEFEDYCSSREYDFRQAIGL